MGENIQSRLNLQEIICWWQSGCEEGWKPLLTAKLGWPVKMRSVQDNEFGNKRVGSDIICCSPCTVVNDSMSVPSGDVVSFGHHDLYVALESPNIIVKDGWSCLTK